MYHCCLVAELSKISTSFWLYVHNTTTHYCILFVSYPLFFSPTCKSNQQCWNVHICYRYVFPLLYRHFRIVIFSLLGQLFCVCHLLAVIEEQIGNHFFVIRYSRVVDIFTNWPLTKPLLIATSEYSEYILGGREHNHKVIFFTSDVTGTCYWFVPQFTSVPVLV